VDETAVSSYLGRNLSGVKAVADELKAACVPIFDQSLVVRKRASLGQIAFRLGKNGLQGSHILRVPVRGELSEETGGDDNDGAANEEELVQASQGGHAPYSLKISAEKM
jgi:hypothetical protein